MKLKNFGPIKELEFEIGKINIICGDNNTGKTYLSYFMYGFKLFISTNGHFKLSKIAKASLAEKKQYNYDYSSLQKEVIRKETNYLNNDFVGTFSSFFNVDDSFFSTSKFEISDKELKQFIKFNNENIYVEGEFNGEAKVIVESIEGNILVKIDTDMQKWNNSKKTAFFEKIEEVINSSIMLENRNYYFPAERIGINLFKDKIDSTDLRLLEMIKSAAQFDNKKDDKMKVLNKSFDFLFEREPDLPKPVIDYIRFLRNFDYSKNHESDILEFFRSKIMQGKIIVKDDKIYFRKRLGAKKFEKMEIPLHATSSSIKSLYGLDVYLSMDQSKNDSLFIDEPEINLHPKNQVLFCELIKMIHHSDVNVTIATHSDYIIRKITNLVLNGDIEEKNLNCIILSGKNQTLKVSDENFISNFDDVLDQLQEEYFGLL